MVHRGAKKLRMNAKPLGHPLTTVIVSKAALEIMREMCLQLVKSQRAKRTVFLNSVGVVIGRTMIIIMQSLRTGRLDSRHEKEASEIDAQHIQDDVDRLEFHRRRAAGLLGHRELSGRNERGTRFARPSRSGEAGRQAWRRSAPRKVT